eukprot:8147034-Lingulodinium_polyedra.AAC.1
MLALRAGVYAPAASTAGVLVATAAWIYGESAINVPVPGRAGRPTCCFRLRSAPKPDARSRG